MKKYFLCVLAFLVASSIFAQTYIILDAKHGGKDLGAEGYCKENGKIIYLQEKNITLKIVKELEGLLTKGTKNATILLSRDKDVDCSNKDRIKHLKNIPCGSKVIYVSIGVNNSTDKTKNGFVVYIPAMGSSQFRLANALSAGLNDTIGTQMEDLGLERGNGTDAYSSNINVDIGFLSNDKDAKLLNQDDFIKKCADGLFQGIKTFMNYRQKPRG